MFTVNTKVWENTILPNYYFIFASQALQHLGITPSLTQREQIRKRLKSDAFGSVSYGGFLIIIFTLTETPFLID